MKIERVERSLSGKELRRVSEDPPVTAIRAILVRSPWQERDKKQGRRRHQGTQKKIRMFHRIVAGFIGCAFLLMAGTAFADDLVLTLKDHKFSPQQLVIPAGKKVRITVKNMDNTPAEFESYDLNREKIVKGGEEITVLLGPLDPGVYQFFDDFHKDTTTGTIKAQ